MGGFAIHWTPSPVIVSVIPSLCKAEDLSRNISTCLLQMRMALEKEEIYRGYGALGSGIPIPLAHNCLTGSMAHPYTSSIPLHTSPFILKREVGVLENHRLHSTDIFSNASKFLRHPPKEGRNPLVQPDSQCVCKRDSTLLVGETSQAVKFLHLCGQPTS